MSSFLFKVWASLVPSSGSRKMRGKSGDAPHGFCSVNNAVTVGAQNRKILKRRCFATISRAERLSMVNLAEAVADIAIDHSEVEAACLTGKSASGM